MTEAAASTTETSAPDRARTLLAGAVNLPEADLPADAAIGSLEGWDSLAHIRLITALEEALERPLTTEEVIGVNTLDSITALLPG
ncbi:MAG: phosphopantetheine-binding protein [Pseudomonadota bacterium]